MAVVLRELGSYPVFRVVTGYAKVGGKIAVIQIWLILTIKTTFIL